MLPLFQTTYSIKNAIFTLDEPEEIKDNSPISIFSVAKTHGIKELYNIETSFSGFIRFYKECKKQNISGRFGIIITVCADIKDKSEDSFKTESKIIIFMKNTQGYYDLCKIYSKSWIEGKYYINRIDWKTLKELWTDNLYLVIPFYDSFLHLNLLDNSAIIPEFPAKPIFLIEEHELPFDYLIKAAVERYTKENNFGVEESHTCYYYKNQDAEAAQVYRLATSREEFGKASLEAPNLDGWASNKFSFEYYLNKEGKQIE